MDTERFMLRPEHLIRQINHFIVHLYTQPLAQICQPVEEIRVSSFEIYRNDIPLMFDCLLNKRFLPVSILYLSVYLTRTKSCGERHDLIFGSISLVDQPGIVFTLRTMFVDRDKDGP